MTAWTVEWTPLAQRDAARLAAWWAKHRGALPELLQRELLEAAARILATPGIGAPHHARSQRPIRRIVLPKTGYLLFYSPDHSACRIDILRLWSSRRGRAPRFPAS